MTKTAVIVAAYEDVIWEKNSRIKKKTSSKEFVGRFR
jgi:hypothetical protein